MMMDYPSSSKDVDFGPGDSVERNFLRACCQGRSQTRPSEHMKMVKACVKVLKVNINCQAVGDTRFLLQRDRQVSNLYSGYTGLHFAVKSIFGPTPLSKFLLSQPNIDVNKKESFQCQTPVMLLISQTLKENEFGVTRKPSCYTKEDALMMFKQLLSVNSLILDTACNSLE